MREPPAASSEPPSSVLFGARSSADLSACFSTFGSIYFDPPTKRHHRLFRRSDRARERCLGEVVRVQRVDVTLRRDGHRLLRLRDLDIAGDARRKAIARLLQLLTGERHVGLRRFELLARGAQIEQSRSGRRTRHGRGRLRARPAGVSSSASVSMRLAVDLPASKIGTRTVAATRNVACASDERLAEAP